MGLAGLCCWQCPYLPSTLPSPAAAGSSTYHLAVSSANDDPSSVSIAGPLQTHNYMRKHRPRIVWEDKGTPWRPQSAPNGWHPPTVSGFPEAFPRQHCTLIWRLPCPCRPPAGTVRTALSGTRTPSDLPSPSLLWHLLLSGRLHRQQLCHPAVHGQLQIACNVIWEVSSMDALVPAPLCSQRHHPAAQP